MSNMAANNASVIYEITPESVPPADKGKRYTINFQLIYCALWLLCTLCSHVYRIGEILRDRESRKVEYKTGGGNYSHTVLKEVNHYLGLHRQPNTMLVYFTIAH